jgi:CheY-like chemotaxis protein
VKISVAKKVNGEPAEVKLANNDLVQASLVGRVRIHVTDTGVGMTKEQLATVFDDGVQFNKNILQSGKGSGLGLFIAKGIAEQHGGELTVSSKGMGLGTTFTLALPLNHVADWTPVEAVDKALEKKDKLLDLREAPKLRVLVVDDNDLSRKLLMRMLTNRGHKCEQACNGEEAVLCFSDSTADQFDCILLDYEMPVQNGPSACKNMRELGCSAFVVGVTGNLLPEDVAHFQNCGANAVLPKPFKISDLEQLWVEYGLSGTPDETAEKVSISIDC